ncbi:MAG: hypothetical protein WC804_20460 [Sphingomonas sp.]|jgi:hypothetical protein|uniref:hypothetical protein n=1 Tax=Sphingomonas sp. TaxID=28214 RepID=UPI003567BDCE
MNKFVYVLPLLALAACSKPPQSDDQPPRRSAADESDVSAPVGIGVTAAPGVAFSYHYAFSLGAARIAGAQEAHAQACEKLGIARCRITGMKYQLLGENRVAAMLAFKLDPAIARAFGKNAVAIAQAAEGTLTEAEITGTDAGSAIDTAESDRARARAEVQRIDGELARKGLKDEERTTLQQQRADTARVADAAVDTAASARASLATTPLVLDYSSDAVVQGFDGSAPLKSALALLIGSAETTFTVLLGAFALLGPPGLVVLLGWIGWRRFGPKRRRPVVSESESAATG